MLPADDLTARVLANPAVQEAAINTAQEQGAAAARAGKASYCESLSDYVGLCKTTSIIDNRFFGCQDSRAGWASSFEYWNITRTRIHVIMGLLYAVLWFVLCLSVGNILGCIVMPVIVFLPVVWFVFLDHLSWHSIVVHEGCGGNIGNFIWCIVLLLTAIPFYVFFVLNVLSLLYLLTVIPLCFMALACCKMGAENTARDIAEAVRGGAADTEEAFNGVQDPSQVNAH